jgi:hypothetical protein
LRQGASYPLTGEGGQTCGEREGVPMALNGWGTGKGWTWVPVEKAYFITVGTVYVQD